ncbi:MAG TPA: hypothetical protein VF625_07575, partial [Longimicrobium sp.]
MIAAEEGAERIICEPSGPDRACKLTFLGFASWNGSAVLINCFLAVVREAARHYLDSESTESISISGIGAELGFSDLVCRQVGELIYLNAGIWSGMVRS